MKHNILKFALGSFFWVVYTLPLTAGPEDPDTGGDPPWEDPTPIDNWIWGLIMMGMAIGLYFFTKQRRRLLN